jgi:hypothetical protein
MEFLKYLLFGCLCPRCKKNRTGQWGRYITGVPFDEYICDDCDLIERIKRQNERTSKA